MSVEIRKTSSQFTLRKGISPDMFAAVDRGNVGGSGFEQ